MERITKIAEHLFKKRFGLFERYFATFCVIIIVPFILASAVIYYYSVRIIEEDANTANSRLLTNVAAMTDEKLSEIYEILSYLSNNPTIRNAMNYRESYEGADLLELYMDVAEILTDALTTRDYIADIYVHFYYDDWIISARDGSFSYDSYFKLMSSYKEMDPAQFKSILRDVRYITTMKTMTIHTGGHQRNIITVVSPLPLVDEKKGALVINIDESSFFNSIRNGVKHQNDILVMNEKNEIISYIGEKYLSVIRDEGLLNRIVEKTETDTMMEINRVDTQVTCVTSDFNGWRYIAFVPVNDLLKKAHYIRNVSIGTCMFLLFAGVGISFMTSRKIYNPIKEISYRLNSYRARNPETGEKKEDEFKIINQSLSSIFLENDRLMSRYNESRQMVVERFLYLLIKGHITDPEEIQRNMEKFDLPIKDHMYVPVLIDIHYYKDLQVRMTEQERRIIHADVKQVLETLICKNTNGTLIELEDSRFFAVLPFFRMTKEHIADIVHGIANEFDRYTSDIDTTIAIGGSHNKLKDLNHSYKQLNSLIEQRPFGERNQVMFLWEMELLDASDDYMPGSERKQLENSLRNGDNKHALSIVKTVLDKCLQKKLKYRTVKLILQDLLNSVFNSVEGTGNKPEDIFENYYSLYEELKECRYAEEIEEFFKNICLTVAKHINKMKEHNESNTVNELLAYIHQNYDKQISLELMAENMGVSNSYLSRFFKDRVGENFVDYLNKVRISKAKELLSHSRMKVKDISEKVGYTSCNTFNIVFKKYEGISPGTFRENLKEGFKPG